MATINTLSGTSAGDIDSLSAVPSSTIGSISGITFPNFEGLLDTYPGAAAGYSVRRLATSATNLMRIREDAGDTETDIGYDSNNELDTAAIAAHCGSADGFVVTWTDQSSNANDAEQAAVVNQPQIYDGATAAVILENGKPAVETTGAHLQLATALTSVSDIFWVAKANSTNFSYLVKSSGDLAVRSLSLAYRLVTTSAGDWTNTSSYVYFNGVAQTSDPSSASQGLGYIGGGSRDFLQISTDFGGGGPVRDWEGNIQEILLWPSSQTTPTDNRTGIETNINTEFSVYPTSGLLFNYPNAHAAYSLRQLQNLQTYAIRIQRHVAPFDTLDIGFDGSGGLDTSAITTFAGSDVCGVETWYDQQHNSSKDITQALTSNQPLIFDGSSVYLVNGKPAIYYDTSVKQLSCPLYLGSGAQCDILNVHQRVSGAGYFLHWEGSGGFQVIDMRTVNYDMGWLGGTVGGAYGTTQNLMTAITNGSAGQFRINGVAGSVGTLDANRKFNSEFAIQGRPGFPGSNPGPVIYQQEFIQYDFNNTSGDLSSIETNVNAYYSIYP